MRRLTLGLHPTLGGRSVGLLGGKKKQRIDSTHVMAAIRAINLLELAGETMRRTQDAIAGITPEWPLAQMRPEWVKR